MRRTTMPTRVICVLLASALTSSLIPAVAFGVGAEDSANSSDTSQTEESQDASQPNGEAIEHINKEVSVDASSEQSKSANTTATQSNTSAADELDVLSASIAIDTKQTLLSYKGLTYQINEDAQTLSCIGCSDTTLTGALNIPSQVVVGDKTYKVSAIEKTWGGVQILS